MLPPHSAGPVTESDEQPGTEAFTRAVLDTLDSRLVVLDGVGRTLGVNAAREAAARRHGA